MEKNEIINNIINQLLQQREQLRQNLCLSTSTYTKPAYSHILEAIRSTDSTLKELCKGRDEFPEIEFPFNKINENNITHP